LTHFFKLTAVVVLFSPIVFGQVPGKTGCLLHCGLRMLEPGGSGFANDLAVAGDELFTTRSSLATSTRNVADFEKFENEHLADAQHSIDAVLAVNGPRTIQNTLAPYDEAIRQIDLTRFP